MIGNQLENDIIGIFSRDPTQFISINQISRILNKAYPHINSKVNKLIDEGILNKLTAGRSYLCSINLENDKAMVLLAINEIQKKEKLMEKLADSGKIQKELHDIKSEFQVYTIFYQNKKLCIVLDHLYDMEAIKNRYRHIRKLKPLFMTKHEFQSMACERSFLLDPTILYSPESYYELINGNLPKLIMHGVTHPK